jgi:hypothetical protein
MLEQLVTRVTEYTLQKGLDFYNSEPLSNSSASSPEYPLSAWGLPNNTVGFNFWLMSVHNRATPPHVIREITENGTFMYRESTAVYFRNDGHIFKLSRTHLPHDWKMHNALYTLNQKEQLIRMEIPIHGHSLTLNGFEYWYTEVFRDNYNSSYNIHQVHSEKKLNKHILINLVDDAVKMVHLVKQVSDTYQAGCPEISTHLSKFFTDTSSKFGGCWTDLKHWNISFDLYVTKAYSNILHYLDDHKYDDVISDSEALDILRYTIKKLKPFGVDESVFRLLEHKHLDNVCNVYTKHNRTFEGTHII